MKTPVSDWGSWQTQLNRGISFSWPPGMPYEFSKQDFGFTYVSCLCAVHLDSYICLSPFPACAVQIIMQQNVLLYDLTLSQAVIRVALSQTQCWWDASKVEDTQHTIYISKRLKAKCNNMSFQNRILEMQCPRPLVPGCTSLKASN